MKIFDYTLSLELNMWIECYYIKYDIFRILNEKKLLYENREALFLFLKWSSQNFLYSFWTMLGSFLKVGTRVLL